MDNNRSLQEIGHGGKGAGNDARGGHHYLVVYDALFFRFRFEDFNMLELGVHEGLSLKLWEEYFPKANITGVDNWSAGLEPKIEFGDRIHIVKADVGGEVDKALPDQKFKVIIDDASHKEVDQKNAFDKLYSFLTEDGFYIIEDISDDARRDSLVAYMQTKGFKTLVFDNRQYTHWNDSMMIVAYNEDSCSI